MRRALLGICNLVLHPTRKHTFLQLLAQDALDSTKGRQYATTVFFENISRVLDTANEKCRTLFELEHHNYDRFCFSFIIYRCWYQQVYIDQSFRLHFMPVYIRPGNESLPRDIDKRNLREQIPHSSTRPSRSPSVTIALGLPGP